MQERMSTVNHDIIEVIIPVYNEGNTIFNNIMTIHNYLISQEISHSFLLIDDGSKDNSFEEMKRLNNEIKCVKLIGLSKNFGKENALCAGIMESAEDACVIMDSDLQHPPQMIPEMLRVFNEGYDIVECIKNNRGKESFFYKLTVKTFYKFLNRISGFDMGNSSDFKLINRKVMEAWKQVGDRNIFFRGTMEWVGFRKAQIPFEVKERNGGETKFSTFKLVRLALDAITSFSSAPLFLTNFLGLAFFAGALILGGQTLYNKLAGVALSGFSTVILLLLIVGGAILISLGIIGTYISKIYDEVKNRPRYIIDKKIDKKTEN